MEKKKNTKLKLVSDNNHRTESEEKKHMGKHIILNDKDGNEYTLEFSRKTVETMERNGFSIDTDRPNTMVDQLFRGAFQMHHRNMSPDKIRGIWAAQTAKDELLTALVQLYMEPLETLMAEPEGEAENPPTWKLV